MTRELKSEAGKFCSLIFDTVRKMSIDGEGVTRQGYSQTESDVLDYLKTVGEELGLKISTDPAGNVWMRLPGQDPSLPAFVAGSHADSVPQGGNFDGLAGIVAALAVVWWMRETNYTPKRDFVVLMMRCEESSFYGKPYIGSLAFTGKLTKDDIMLKHRTKDTTLGECMAACGFNPADLITGKPLVDLKKIAAFVELHIEQGPTLDSSADTRVGIVTGIRGNVRNKKVHCWGQTAHSGAVDKQYRHDAVMATADLLHRMDRAWDEWLKRGDDLVFTVGVLNTAPTAAISVIPGETTFTIDIRSLKDETFMGFHELLEKEAQIVARERGVRFEFDRNLISAPGHVNAQLSDRLAAAAQAEGISVRRLASGAGHDAAVIGSTGVPVAMIFVANQNGSHNPYEHMELKDFLAGAQVLWGLVSRFDA